jgi:plasmid maintenance system killer protein
MLVEYNSNKEERFYSCFDSLTKKHGADMARKIIQRIGQLDAAPNPLSLPNSARFHEHKGKRKGLFSVDLIHPYRLIVLPTCSFSNFNEINSLKIYEVFNPHN